MNIKRILKKIDSRYITLLLVSIPLAIIFYFAIVVRGDREKEILSNHFNVIGEIINVRYKVVEVEYEINGRKYVYNDAKPYKNLVVSENYECFVSKKDITNAIILYSRPIIDTVKYNYDTINATHIEYLSNEIEILFDYEVKGGKSANTDHPIPFYCDHLIPLQADHPIPEHLDHLK